MLVLKGIFGRSSKLPQKTKIGFEAKKGLKRFLGKGGVP